MCVVCEGGVPTSAQIKDSIHEDRAAIWQGPHHPTPGGFTEEGPRLYLEYLQPGCANRTDHPSVGHHQGENHDGAERLHLDDISGEFLCA